MKPEGYRLIATNLYRMMTNMLRECPVYEVSISSNILDSYLPDRLLAFTANTRRNILRRRFSFLQSLLLLFLNWIIILIKLQIQSH